MLTQWSRIILSDNGSLTDYTLASQNDTETIALPMVAAEDFVYIGQHFPFNHLFLDVGTVNTASSIMTPQVWQKDAFVDAVDTLDETSVGGATLGRSGNITFSPDRDESWELVEDSSDSDAPPEILAGSQTFYNLYWMRLKVSADLDAGTIVNRIGYRFTDTEQLDLIDPDLTNYLGPWESGKTNWNDQLRLASERVVSDMKRRGIIIHPGQLIRIDEVASATAYKALHMIYTILGPDLNHRRDDADKAYEEIMNAQRFTIDRNRNATEDLGEVQNTVSGSLVR